MNTVFTRRRTWLVLLLGLALIRGLIYMAVIPPWQAPDETGHFEYAWLIAHLGRLPSAQDVSSSFEGEMIESLYKWRYGDLIGRALPEEMPSHLSDLPSYIWPSVARTILSERFSLAYAWQALFLLPFRDQDLVTLLFVARFSSVLLNVGIVWLAFMIFERLLPARSDMPLLMTAMIALWPQHTFINSTVGDGTLAEWAACWVIYGWVCLFRDQGMAYKRAAVFFGTILVAAGIGIWTKTTAVFLAPVSAGLALWWFLLRFRRAWKWQHTVFVCLGVVLLVAGSWAWARYSPLGSRTWAVVQRSLSLSNLTWVDQRGITFGDALLAAYDSFWAHLGWMALPLSERWYGAIALLSLLALAGWTMKGRPNLEPGDTRMASCAASQSDLCSSEERVLAVPSWAAIVMGAFLVVAWGIFIWTALLSRSDGYYQYQGRYVFPVAVPFAFFFVGGLARFFSGIWREYGARLLLFFLIFLDAWCIFVYVLPYFYG